MPVAADPRMRQSTYSLHCVLRCGGLNPRSSSGAKNGFTKSPTICIDSYLFHPFYTSRSLSRATPITLTERDDTVITGQRDERRPGRMARYTL